ncbi:MAG: methyl-accepting chemotaxis protein [Spirochaetes bacterium]|nr:methyl-accepting chemotaxis protein [Spirochaetota bacterium]
MKKLHLVLGVLSVVLIFLSISLSVLISLKIFEGALYVLELALMISLSLLSFLVIFSFVYYTNALRFFDRQIKAITVSTSEGRVVKTGDEILDNLVEVISNHLDEKSKLKDELEHARKENQSLKEYISFIEQGDIIAKHKLESNETRVLVAKAEKKLGKLLNSFFMVLTKISNLVYEGSKITFYLDEDIKKVDRDFNEITILTNDLSKSFVQLSQSLNEFLSIAMESHNKFDKFLEISSSLESSWKKTYSSYSEATRLNKEMFNEINDVINTAKVISDISEQTLILAMNALIESSKVGDVGKGFSVIADEIRRLSENVSKFSKNITEKLQSIKGKSNLMTISIENISSESNTIESYAKNIEEMSLDTRNSFGKIIDTTEFLSSSINDVSYKIYNTTDKVSLFRKTMDMMIKERISPMKMSISSASEFLDDFRLVLSNEVKVKNDSMLVSLAIADHVLWVARLKGFIDGKSTIDESVVFDHTKCRLGKWYYSEGIVKYSQFPEFKSIEKPHERLHSTGKEIVEVIQTDRQKANELFNEIIKYSSLIVEGLSKLLERTTTEDVPE